MEQERTKFISPNDLHDDPSRFSGVLTASIDPTEGIVPLKMATPLHSLMRKMYPDWQQKLDAYIQGQIDAGYLKWAEYPNGTPRLVGFLVREGENIAYMVFWESFFTKGPQLATIQA